MSARRKQERPDVAKLPAAGFPTRRNLNTQDVQKLQAGAVPTHHTFVDGAVQERPGGRRPPTRGTPAVTTNVHKCLGRALTETSDERSVAQHFTVVNGDIPMAKPKGGRRHDGFPDAIDPGTPRQGKAHVAMQTSVGRVLRQEQEPGASVGQRVLVIR